MKIYFVLFLGITSFMLSSSRNCEEGPFFLPSCSNSPQCGQTPVVPQSVKIGATEYLIFGKGYETSFANAAATCATLGAQQTNCIDEHAQQQPCNMPTGPLPINMPDNTLPNGMSGIPLQDFPNFSPGGSSPNPVFSPNNGTLLNTSQGIPPLPSGTVQPGLADITPDLFQELSSKISDHLYINSWNGDTFNGSCLSLYPGGAIAVPVEGCDGPLGFICQRPATSDSDENEHMMMADDWNDPRYAENEYSWDDSL